MATGVLPAVEDVVIIRPCANATIKDGDLHGRRFKDWSAGARLMLNSIIVDTSSLPRGALEVRSHVQRACCNSLKTACENGGATTLPPKAEAGNTP